MSARVTLYSKPGCHLCDDARAVIERVCADLGESYDERSILDDPALMERYAEEIPVTLVDGRQHDFWRVDETRLARFKQPSRVEVVGELPVGVTGKVQKGRLRGMERRRALGLLE